MAKIAFTDGSYDPLGEKPKDVRGVCVPEANAVVSETCMSPLLHMPVIDIDVPLNATFLHPGIEHVTCHLDVFDGDEAVTFTFIPAHYSVLMEAKLLQPLVRAKEMLQDLPKVTTIGAVGAVFAGAEELRFVPSTNNHHLYVDDLYNAQSFFDKMKILAEVGIVERGYVGASEKVGYAAVRGVGVQRPERTEKDERKRRRDDLGAELDEHSLFILALGAGNPDFGFLAYEEEPF